MASPDSSAADIHKDHLPLPDAHEDDLTNDKDDDDKPEYDDDDLSDADTASQRSISLSSPSHTRPPSAAQSFQGTKTTDIPVPIAVQSPSPAIPSTPSPPVTPPTASYPPPPLQKPDSRGSIASFALSSMSYSKKARPESVLVNHNGPIVLGIALVDFNHLVRGLFVGWRNALTDEVGWTEDRVFQLAVAPSASLCSIAPLPSSRSHIDARYLLDGKIGLPASGNLSSVHQIATYCLGLPPT